MKVLFIYSSDDIQSVRTPLRSWSTIQFGISYISALLKANGHDTRLTVLGSANWESSTQVLSEAIAQFAPRLICFTAVYSQYAFVERLAAHVRAQWPDIFRLVGGVHPTLSPDEAARGPFDAVCIGEGEHPTLELCHQLEAGSPPSGIANLWIKRHDGSVEKNEPREFLRDLDALPFPDRAMWEPWMKEQIGGEIAVLLGRGCPYGCTYCSNHALRAVAGGRYVRMRSAANIIQEVAYLHQQYPQHTRFYFEVESILLNKEWMFDLCNQLAEFNASVGGRLSYGCNYRISPQAMDESVFAALRKANFYKIHIGLESGSERVRREVLDRRYSNEDFLKVVSLARQYGLRVYVFNMIGLPGESLSEHMETVAANRQAQPDGHFTGIFFPYPGTKLYDTCIEQKLIGGAPVTERERRQPIIALPDFSKRQIRHAYTWFNFRVYRGHQPLWRILVKVATVKLKSNPATNLAYRQLVQLPGLRKMRAALALRGGE